MWLCVSTRPGNTRVTRQIHDRRSGWHRRRRHRTHGGDLAGLDDERPALDRGAVYGNDPRVDEGGGRLGLSSRRNDGSDRRQQHGSPCPASPASNVHRGHESPLKKSVSMPQVSAWRSDARPTIRRDQLPLVQLGIRTPMERDSRRGLHVAWSQDELHKRTRLERFAADWWRPVLAAALVLGAIAMLVIGAGIAITEGALHPPRRLPAPEEAADAKRVATEAGATLNEVPLIAHDGAVLAAWSVSKPGPASGTVVVLHGIGDGRASQLPLAALLLSDGYRVLVPDARAHGASGGAMLTAGIAEAIDLGGWVEWIRQQHPNECVFAIGTSFGGATALQSLSRTPYCAVVVEAPFASAYSMAFYWLGGRVPLVVRWALMGPVVEAGFAYARWNYGLPLRAWMR